MYYEIGIGIGLAFAVFVLLVLVLNKKKKTKQIMYDEMQTAVRGRAYQYATITGVLAGIIASCLVEYIPHGRQLCDDDGQFSDDNGLHRLYGHEGRLLWCVWKLEEMDAPDLYH